MVVLKNVIFSKHAHNQWIRVEQILQYFAYLLSCHCKYSTLFNKVREHLRILLFCTTEEGLREVKSPTLLLRCRVEVTDLWCGPSPQKCSGGLLKRRGLLSANAQKNHGLNKGSCPHPMHFPCFPYSAGILESGMNNTPCLTLNSATYISLQVRYCDPAPFFLRGN